MSEEVRREVGELLTQQPLGDECAECAHNVDQRERARRWAVWLEGENAHLEQERDALIFDRDALVEQLCAARVRVAALESGEQVTPE